MIEPTSDSVSQLGYLDNITPFYLMIAILAPLCEACKFGTDQEFDKLQPGPCSGGCIVTTTGVTNNALV